MEKNQTNLSTAQHTPGPWFIGGATPLRPTLTIFNRPFGLGDVAETYSEADARLIAAAPELLFELEGILAFSDGFGVYGTNPVAVELRRWIEGARAAIAKATGSAA